MLHEPKKQNNSVVVAEALDRTQVGRKTVPLKSNSARVVPAIPAKSNSPKTEKNNVKKFWLARVAERFVKERENESHTSSIIQQSGENARSDV